MSVLWFPFPRIVSMHHTGHCGRDFGMRHDHVEEVRGGKRGVSNYRTLVAVWMEHCLP
jgi:hypothetical protein